MIIGIGIDIVEMQRIKKLWDRYGLKFALRILTQEELEIFSKKQPVEYLASRFAAKEAGVKALGTGFINGLTLKSVCIRANPDGKPILIFKEKAEEEAKRLGVKKIHLSITHTKNTAGAVVVLEG